MICDKCYDKHEELKAIAEKMAVAAKEYREADKFAVNIGLQYGYESNEWKRADDNFMSKRIPLDEALTEYNKYRGE